MALLLSFSEVEKLLSMKECIGVVEQAFADYASGRADVPLRLRVPSPDGLGTAYYMPGALSRGEHSALGLKIATEFPMNRERGLPSVLGTIVLLDPETGNARAIMDGRHITNVRTGAASGVAAKYLARADAQAVGILGLGQQAWVQLWAMKEVRRIRSIKAYSPSGRKGRGEWAAAISARLGVTIEIVASPEEACRDRDIIILATNHPGPVLDGDWVRPGVFVNAIGLHTPEFGELDAKTIGKAELIVCDERDAAVRESGDIISAVKSGAIDPKRLVNLGEIVLGRAKGRATPDQITIYRSLGNAFQDLAAAHYVYERARKAGVGREFDFK